jgi:hypothetical protein
MALLRLQFDRLDTAGGRSVPHADPHALAGSELLGGADHRPTVLGIAYGVSTTEDTERRLVFQLCGEGADGGA